MNKTIKSTLQRIIMFSLLVIMSLCQPVVYGATEVPEIDSSDLYSISINSNGSLIFAFDPEMKNGILRLFEGKKLLADIEILDKSCLVEDVPSNVAINYVINFDLNKTIETISGILVIENTEKNVSNLKYSTISEMSGLSDEEIMMLSSNLYESESNDSFSSADRTYDDDNMNGCIDSGSDIDYYKIKFDVPGKVNFWLGSIPSNCDYDLKIYDSNYSLKWMSENAGNSDELISLKLVEADVYYYMKVYSYSGYDDVDQYLLRAKLYYGNMGWGYMYTDSDNRYISSGYGLPSRPDHYGIDIVSSNSSDPIDGDAINNVYSGKVAYVGIDSPSAGNYAVVETDSIDPETGKKLRVRYLHMKYLPSVSKDDSISKGTLVGYTGNTGLSSGPHLHFDVNNESKISYLDIEDTINPELFFPTISFSGDTSL
ncbi:MAG: M23 family metallopeptidase [Tissierellales bacterium]|nr:M23 family metallopeptidase [Tissierellales bacterium]MBN2826369.1 M23 family metallopeptidase [Tissierellales bacterium]